jgi:hypothetical protein
MISFHDFILFFVVDILIRRIHFALNSVAARSKAWVCCRLLAAIAGLNPTCGVNVSCECCVLAGKVLGDGPITLPEECD